MLLLLFLVEAFLISLSGAMAPGPVMTVTIGQGSRSPHAGAWIAAGHGAVEAPFIVAVMYGVGPLLSHSYVQAGIALAGGAFLMAMGVGMFRSLRGPEMHGSTDNRSPVVAGALLTASNPYFLIWWATVGAALIMRSVAFGAVGFAAFVIVHWLTDFLCSYLLSVLSYNGGHLFGPRFQRTVFALCGVVLVFFSLKLIVDGTLRLVG
jgi:threonine/homoserine/homoserine lactone efflux protein